jgi:hypothetical protein
MTTTSNNQPHDNATARPDLDLAAATIEARRQRRSSSRLKSLLAKVLGRPNVSPSDALRMLTAEAELSGADGDSAQRTHGEALVQGIGEASANAHRARTQRIQDKHDEEIALQEARLAELTAHAQHLFKERVRHPDGGLRPVDEVARDEEAQRVQIEDDRARGSRKHHRLPRWIGGIPRIVLVVDLSLLLYFFAGITDVDWSSPLSADLAFALLLAVMVTVLSYGFLAFAGHRLRSYKDHSGAIPVADLDGLTKTSAVAGFVVIAVLAALMFTRMRTEVLYALGPGNEGTALLVALTLAVVSALANFLVIAIHALDGSDQVTRLEALSEAVRRPLAEAHKTSEEAKVIPSRIVLLQSRADRATKRGAADADRQVTAAAQIIDAAHAHQQALGRPARLALDPGQQSSAAGDPASTGAVVPAPSATPAAGPAPAPAAPASVPAPGLKP